MYQQNNLYKYVPTIAFYSQDHMFSYFCFLKIIQVLNKTLTKKGK